MWALSRKILLASLCFLFLVAAGCGDESARDDVVLGDAGQDTDSLTDTGSDIPDSGTDAG